MQISRACRLSYRIEVGPGPAEDSLFESCWYSLSKHSKQLVSSRWISSPVNRYVQLCFQCLTSLCPCSMPVRILFQKFSFSFSIFFWAARFCACFFFGRRNVLFLPTIFWRKNKWQQNPKDTPFPSLQLPVFLFQWRKAEQREMENVKAKPHLVLKTKTKQIKKKKGKWKFVLKSRKITFTYLCIKVI